jgi:predicted RNase H-like HicB family nuclease
LASQGEPLEELEENIRDAYRMLLEEQEAAPVAGTVESKEIEVPA